MYDEIILDKAVQIAAKNGWDGDIERSGYAPLIFNKDFARALWGEGKNRPKQGFNMVTGLPLSDEEKEALPKDAPLWEYHLREMVVAPDPIKYLSDNMP